MKPFIGIDITENKNNEIFNGKEFIVQNVSSMRQQAFEKATDNAMDLGEKAKLPLPLRIFHWICGFVGTILTIGVIRAIGDEDGVTIAQAYQNAPWFFWVAGVCLVVWVILKAISLKKEKEILNSTEGDNAKRTLEFATKSIYDELGVPDKAFTVDVLGFTYKIKDGEPKAKETGFNPTAYLNLEVKVFVNDGKLFLADLENKYAFLLSEMRAIRTVQKGISVSGWNKDVQPNKGIYKPYKMTIDDYDCVHFKPYHILEFEHNGEEWGIYFPCYELEVFEKLTGLKAK